MTYSEAEIRLLFENYTDDSLIRDLIYTTKQGYIFKVHSKLNPDSEEYPLLVLNPGISRENLLSIDFNDCQILKICAIARTVQDINFVEFFMNFKDPIIRCAVALNPKTPVKILEQLVEDEEIRASVAANVSVPAEMLEKLAVDEDSMVRIAVAFNPSTPIHVLKEFARDKEKELRAITAINVSAPSDLLNELSNDKEVWVREMVARNISTPIEVLEKLAQDQDEIVREKVASNRSTPVYLLEKLARDKAEFVLEMLGHNTSTPAELLKKLGKNKKDSVRAHVASNPSTPGEVLKKLADDDEYYIRELVALNPSTPGEVLKKLADEEDIKELVESNSATPVELLKSLFSDNEEFMGIDGINNNLGNILYFDYEDRNLGIEYLQKAAENGQPNAIITLLWINIINNDIKLAISNFEKYSPKTDEWIKNEERKLVKFDFVDKDDIDSHIESFKNLTPIILGNAALAYYIDNQKNKAKELWDESTKICKDLEIMLFKTLLLNENMSDSELDELNKILNKNDLYEKVTEWAESLEISSNTSAFSAIISKILPKLGSLIPPYEESMHTNHDLDVFEQNLKNSFSEYFQVSKGEKDLSWHFLFMGASELSCIIDTDKGNVLVSAVVLKDIEKSNAHEINTYLENEEIYETWFAVEQEDGLTQIIYVRVVPLEKLLEVVDIETEFSIAASNSNNFLTRNLQNTFGGKLSSISNIPWHEFFKHTFDDGFLNELGIK